MGQIAGLLVLSSLLLTGQLASAEINNSAIQPKKKGAVFDNRAYMMAGDAISQEVYRAGSLSTYTFVRAGGSVIFSGTDPGMIDAFSQTESAAREALRTGKMVTLSVEGGSVLGVPLTKTGEDGSLITVGALGVTVYPTATTSQVPAQTAFNAANKAISKLSEKSCVEYLAMAELSKGDQMSNLAKAEPSIPVEAQPVALADQTCAAAAEESTPQAGSDDASTGSQADDSSEEDAQPVGSQPEESQPEEQDQQ